MNEISCEKESAYSAGNRMRDLIESDRLLLMVISRFGISLGFADRTIADVCRSNHVDTPTFLAIANFISDRPYDDSHINLESLMGYLKRAHSYFLGYFLPSIRKKLIEVIGYKGENDLSMLLLKFYDEYVEEVERHMAYENETVFGYVEGIIAGKLDEEYSISKFADKHDNMSTKLKELKDIIIRYYPQNNGDLLNSVLLDLISCEHDLQSHCRIEDRIFVPQVKRREEALRRHILTQNESNETDASDEEKVEALSNREKDIIVCVAKGMSNKEIGDELCISMHTVTTHRRNISNKLQIHSPAGLTIFAIINNLVSLDEIKVLK